MALACLIARSPLAAEDTARFNIPAQALSSALISLATQADISIGLTGVVLTNQVSAPVSGNLTVAQALDALLSSTSLTAEMVGPGTWRIFLRPLTRDVKFEEPTIPLALPPIEEIVVTAIKRPTSLQTASLSVGAVTGGTFTDYGVRSTH